MTSTATYTCQARSCGKACRAAVGDVLGLLALYKSCFDARYAAGLKAMEEAERKAKEQ